jgi:hypothetical protein
MERSFKADRIVRAVLSVLAAILVGAIGSGVWERMVRPAWEWTASKAVDLLGQLSMTFRDSIYSAAASEAFRNRAREHLELSMVFVAVGALIFLVYIRHRGFTILREALSDIADSPGWRRTYTVLLSALVVGVIIGLARGTYQSRIQSWSLRSIEILGGSTTVEETRKLRAKFFSVESAADFYAFVEAVRAIEQRTGVKLPDFEPL